MLGEFRSERLFQMYQLIFEDAGDASFHQCVLVRKAAVDRSRRKARMFGNTRNGGAFQTVLRKHLYGRFDQLGLGFAAACLTRGEW